MTYILFLLLLFLGASAPNMHVVNKTSSAVSFHFDEPVCGGGNSGYIYQYLIYYSLTGEPKFGSSWNFVHIIKHVCYKEDAQNPLQAPRYPALSLNFFSIRSLCLVGDRDL